MNDLKPFKHGQEGTHYACVEMIKKYGSKVGCCGCNKHMCDAYPWEITTLEPRLADEQTKQEKGGFLIDDRPGVIPKKAALKMKRMLEKKGYEVSLVSEIDMEEKQNKNNTTDWEKLMSKPYHEWKNDEDIIVRTIYFINQLSPHNLWKGYEAVQDLLKKRDEQYAMEIATYESNEEQRMTVYKAGLIEEIEGMKKKMCCDECDSFDDKNQTLSHVIERIKKYGK